MTFIEGELFHDKRKNLFFYESSHSILLERIDDYIYWAGAFPRKESKLHRSQKVEIWFFGTKSWWHLLNGSSSKIRERSWPFPKASSRFYRHWVLMEFIEWSSSTIRERNWSIRKSPNVFFLWFLKGFLEGGLFCDKRRKLIVY
jgi:hypothetical protein